MAVGVPSGGEKGALRACRRGMEWVSLAMILAEIASLTVQALLVVGHTGITAAQALSGGPVIAQSCAAFCALVLWLLARFSPDKLSAWLLGVMLAAATGLMGSAGLVWPGLFRLDP